MCNFSVGFCSGVVGLVIVVVFCFYLFVFVLLLFFLSAFSSSLMEEKGGEKRTDNPVPFLLDAEVNENIGIKKKL